MKTCGTCKFKGKSIEQTTFFICDRINHSEEFKTKGSLRKMDVGLKALIYDGDGYYAVLCVEDDFGCSLWETKT